MKKFKLIYTLLIVGLLALSSCLVDDDPQQLEEAFANLPFTVGFERTSDSYVFLPSDVDPITESVNVNLSGGLKGLTSSTDIVVRYEIDPATTAIQGTEFEINNSSDQITIPANREVSLESLDYTIFPSTLSFDEQKVIVLKLISDVEGVLAADPFATIEIVFERCNPPLVGAYTAANTVNGSSNGDGEAVNITAVSCNTYRADNLPNFNGVFSWDFILNADNSITLTGTLGDNSNVITGSGKLLANGTIQIDRMDVSDTSTGIDMSFDLIPN